MTRTHLAQRLRSIRTKARQMARLHVELAAQAAVRCDDDAAYSEIRRSNAFCSLASRADERLRMQVTA